MARVKRTNMLGRYAWPAVPFLWAALFSVACPSSTEAAQAKVKDAMVILGATPYESARLIMERLEPMGFQAGHFFPPHVFIGRLSGDALTRINQYLKDLCIDQVIVEKAVDPNMYWSYGDETVNAVEIWNTVFAPGGMSSSSSMRKRFRQAPSGTLGKDIMVLPPLAPSLTSTRYHVGGSPPFGSAAGDTSEYMLGSPVKTGTIAVKVLFPESAGPAENWNALGGERFAAMASVVTACKWWEDNAPPCAHVHFVYEGYCRFPSAKCPHMSTLMVTGEPIQLSTTICGVTWMNEMMDQLGYAGPPADYASKVALFADNLRTQLDTDWAFVVFAVRDLNDADGMFPDNVSSFSILGGPFTVVLLQNGWRDSSGNLFFYTPAQMDFVTAHEIGHILYALDEYATGISKPTDESGYLKIRNDNHVNSGLPGMDCIMRSSIAAYTNNLICVPTRHMLGWRDSNGDGIFDIVSVPPLAIFDDHWPDPDPSPTPVFTGVAQVGLLPNLNPQPRSLGHPINVDAVSGVGFLVNDALPWGAASAIDTKWDGGAEAFGIMCPFAPCGVNTVQAKAQVVPCAGLLLEQPAPYTSFTQERSCPPGQSATDTCGMGLVCTQAFDQIGMASDVAVDATGAFFVVGEKGGRDWTNIDCRWYVERYVVAGDTCTLDPSWGDGYAPFYSHAEAVAIDQSGNVFIAGFRSAMGTDGIDVGRLVIRKYSPAGVFLAQYEYTPSYPPYASGELFDLAVDSAGHVIAVGEEQDTSAGWLDRVVIIVCDSNLNALNVWQEQYGENSDATGVVTDGAGHFYVTATYDPLGAVSMRGRVAKYDVTGTTPLAVVEFPGSASAIAMDHNGDLVVTGRASDSFNLQVQRFTPSLSPVWTGYGGWGSPIAVAVDPCGKVGVAGIIGDPWRRDWLMERFDPSGQRITRMTYTNPFAFMMHAPSDNSEDWAHGIAFDNTWAMIVVGWEAEYDPSGLYPGPSHWRIRKYRAKSQLSVTCSVSPSGPIVAGDTFRLVATATNDGTNDIPDTMAHVGVSGPVSLVTGPPGNPVDLEPGATARFTWVYSADDQGVVAFSVSIGGISPSRCGCVTGMLEGTCTSSIVIGPGGAGLGGDWPQFHHDPWHLGTAHGPMCSLVLDWSRLLGARDNSDPVWSYASPSVLGGTLFMGTLNGELQAIRASDGALLWTHMVDQPIDHAPAIVQCSGVGVVVVGTSGGLTGLDANSGNPVWSYPMAGGISKQSPLLDGEAIYAVSTGGIISKVNACDGKQLWLQDVSVGAGAETSPVLGGDVLYVLQTIGGVSVQVNQLDAATGTTLFDWPPLILPNIGHVSSAPAFAAGKLLFGTDDGRLVAFDAATRGFRACQLPNPPCQFSTPAVSGDRLYVGVSDGSGKGFGPGRIVGIWTATIDGSVDEVCASATLLVPTAGDVVSSPAIVAGDGIFYGKDASKSGPAGFGGVQKSGVIQFDYPVPVGRAARGSPAIASDHIFLAATTGTNAPRGDHVLYAFTCACNTVPTGLTAEPTGEGCDVKLCWTLSAGGGYCASVSAFVIYRSYAPFDGPGGAVSGTVFKGEGDCYTSDLLSTSNDTYLRVCAIDAAGIVLGCSPEVRIPPSGNGAPRLEPIVLPDGSINCHFVKPPYCPCSCTLYTVFRSTGPGWIGEPIAVTSQPWGFHDPTPLVPGEDRCYTTMCTDQVCPGTTSMQSCVASASCTGIEISVVVSTTCIEEVGRRVNMTWSPVVRPCCVFTLTITGYTVSRAPAVGGVVTGPFVVIAQEAPWVECRHLDHSYWCQGQFYIDRVPVFCYSDALGMGEYIYRICAQTSTGDEICADDVHVVVSPMLSGWGVTSVVQVHGIPVDDQPLEFSFTWAWSSMRCQPPATGFVIYRSKVDLGGEVYTPLGWAEGPTWEGSAGEPPVVTNVIPTTTTTGTIPPPPIPFCYFIGPGAPVMLSSAGFWVICSTGMSGSEGSSCDGTYEVKFEANVECIEGSGRAVHLKWRTEPNFLGPSELPSWVERAPAAGGVPAGPFVPLAVQTSYCDSVNKLIECTPNLPQPHGLFWISLVDHCATDWPGTGEFVYRVCALSGTTMICSQGIAVVVDPMLSSWAVTHWQQVHGYPLDTQAFELGVTWAFSTTRCESTCQEYRVFRTTGGDGPETALNPPVDPTVVVFTDSITGLLCYRVRCVDSGASMLNAAFGICATGTVPTPSCTATLLVDASASVYCVEGEGREARLRWSVKWDPCGCVPPAVSGYVVFRAPAAGGVPIAPFGEIGRQMPWPQCGREMRQWCESSTGWLWTDSPVYCHTDLPGTGEWAYFVRAVTPNGDVDSIPVSVTIAPMLQFWSAVDMKQVHGVPMDRLPFQLDVVWEWSALRCDETCDAYQVFRATDPGGPFTALDPVLAAPAVTFTDSITGLFCYSVRCVKDGVVALSGTYGFCATGWGELEPTLTCTGLVVGLSASMLCISGEGREIQLRWEVGATNMCDCFLPHVDGFVVNRAPAVGGVAVGPYVELARRTPWDECGLRQEQDWCDWPVEHWKTLSLPVFCYQDRPGTGEWVYQVCALSGTWFVCSADLPVAVEPLYAGKILKGSSTTAPGVILLDWEYASNLCWVPCTEYFVYRNTGSGPVPIARVDENTIVFVDTLPAGVAQACYRLGCVDGGGGLTPESLVCSACLISNTELACSFPKIPWHLRPISSGGPINSLYGTIFVASAPVGGGVTACSGLEVFGTMDGTLYVLYPWGDIRCQRKLDGAIEFAPVYDQCNQRVWVGTSSGNVYAVDLKSCGAAGPVCGGIPVDHYSLARRILSPIALDCKGNPVVSVEDVIPGSRCVVKLDGQDCGKPDGVIERQCFPVGPNPPVPAPIPLPMCGASGVGSCSLFSEACLECPLVGWVEMPGGGILRYQQCGTYVLDCCNCDGHDICCRFDGEVFNPGPDGTTDDAAYIAVNDANGSSVHKWDTNTFTCSLVCELPAKAVGAPAVAGNYVYTLTEKGLVSCCLTPGCVVPDIIAVPDGVVPSDLRAVHIETPDFVTNRLQFNAGPEVIYIDARPGPAILTSVARTAPGVEVNWTPPVLSSSGLPISYYKVFRLDDTVRTAVGTVSSGLSFVDPSAPSAGNVCYQVQAIDTAGDTGIFSNVGCTTPPALLVATMEAGPILPCTGGIVTVTLTVSNAGQSDAVNVTAATPAPSGSGQVSLVSGGLSIPPSTLAPGVAVLFTWTYSAIGEGDVRFTTTVTGLDGPTGNTLSVGRVISDTVFALSPGLLVARLALQPQIASGETFTVSLTVTNVGEAVVTGVSPVIQLTSGAVSWSAGPFPSGVAGLGGGASATFVWSYSATGTQTVCFSATAVGVTCGARNVAWEGNGCTAVAPLPSTVALTITAPGAVVSGVGFQFVVSAQKVDGSLDPGYWGTVAFSSTDPAAQLPTPYAFIVIDAGCREFSATVFALGNPQTVMVETEFPKSLTAQVTLTVLPAPEFIVLPSTSSAIFQGIDFTDRTNGWVVGWPNQNARPLALHFSGNTWTDVPLPLIGVAPYFGFPYYAYGVSLTTADAGWMDASSGGVYELTVGLRYRMEGGTWSKPEQIPGVRAFHADALTMVTTKDGWESMVQMDTGLYQIYHYDGKAWSSFQDVPEGPVYPFRFVKGSPREGWALGPPGIPWRFSRNRWGPDLSYPFPYGLAAIWMNSPTDVWGCIRGRFVHYDGSSWTETVLSESEDIGTNGISFFDADHGIAVGTMRQWEPFFHFPLVFYYAGGKWQSLPVGMPADTSPYPDGLGLHVVRMVGANEAWAHGDSELYMQPQLLHVWIPDGSPSCGSTVPLGVVQASPATFGSNSLKMSDLSVRAEKGPDAAVWFDISISDPCQGALEILSESMVPIARYEVTGPGTHQRVWRPGVAPKDSAPFEVFWAILQVRGVRASGFAAKRFVVDRRAAKALVRNAQPSASR